MWPLVVIWAMDFSTDLVVVGLFSSSMGLDVTMAPGGGGGIGVML